MEKEWSDYIIPVIVCIVFPVLIPVAIGVVIFFMAAAALNSNEEEE